MRRIAAAACIVGALAVAAIAQGSLDPALTAARRGAWARADALTQAYLATHGGDAAAWNLAGLIADHRGEPARAEIDYQTALRYVSSSVLRGEIENNLGNHDLLRGDRAAAEQAFAAALRLDPGEDQARLELVNLALALCPSAAQQPACGARALRLWHGLAAAAQARPAAAVLRVRALLAARQNKQAEAAAAAIANGGKRGGDDAKLAYTLGHAFLTAGDCRPAAAYLHRAWLRVGGDELRLELARAEACAGPTARTAAVADLTALQKSQPKWWQPNYFLARLSGERGDWAGAARLLVEAEGLAKAAGGDPRAAAPIAAALGSLCMKQGFWLDAMDEWQQYARLQPGDPEGQRNLAISAQIGGRDQVAERAMQRFVAARPQDAHGHLLLALIEKDRGELPAAARELAAAVRLDPRLAPAWDAQGQMRLDANDLAGAEVSLRRALAADPRDAKALTALAECESRGGRLAPAIALLERAVRVQPNSLAALYQLSRLYQRAGKPEQAQALRARFEQARPAPQAPRGGHGLLAYFRADASLDPAAQRRHYIRFLRSALASRRTQPAAARLLARLGTAEWQAGERDAARRDLAAALAAPPAALPSADALGAADGLAASGGAAEALPFYDRALAAPAAAGDAHAALGKARALAALGRRQEALAVLAAVPAAAQPRGAAADLYAMFAAGAGQDRKAAAAFRLALAQAPDDPRICRNAAIFLASRGQWQPALDVLAGGIKRQPGDFALRLDRAIVLQLDNRRAQAQADLQRLAADAGDPQMSADETMAALLLGISYYTSDRRAQAAELFRQLSERPGLPTAQSALAWYYRALLARSNGVQALAWCEKSLALRPQYAPALYLRAQLLERRSEDASAAASARAAIAAAPDWSAPRYLLARLLRRGGDAAGAAAQMKEVAALQNSSPRSELAGLLAALEAQP